MRISDWSSDVCSSDHSFPAGTRIGANFAALEGRYDSNGDNVVDKDLDGRNIAPDRLNVFLAAPLTSALRGRVQMSRPFDRRFAGNTSQYDFQGYSLWAANVFYYAEQMGRLPVADTKRMDKNTNT